MKISKRRNIRYNNDENNTMGLSNTVIAVTPVTNENTTELMNYNMTVIYLITCIVFMKEEILGLKQLHG